MSKIHIATIITASHYDKALTMLASMREFHDCHLHILFVNFVFNIADVPENENITIYTPDDIFKGPVGRINRLSFVKYKVPDEDRPSIIASQDYLRWSLKPGFVNQLLESHERIVFCDCDLYFYSDFIEIVDDASEKSLTISPHWRTIHTISTDESKYNFLHGLYNGGFFIATRDARKILEWWAEQCCIECSATSESTYVDQKYLDLVPLYFDNVGIIQHKGYNVAAWNANYLERTVKNDEVLIDGYKIVFIHYSPVTIKYITTGLDIQLTEHLVQYRNALHLQQVALFRQNKLNFMSEKPHNASEVI